VPEHPKLGVQQTEQHTQHPSPTTLLQRGAAVIGRVPQLRAVARRRATPCHRLVTAGAEVVATLGKPISSL
jgi:hypothetical protein